MKEKGTKGEKKGARKKKKERKSEITVELRTGVSYSAERLNC